MLLFAFSRQSFILNIFKELLIFYSQSPHQIEHRKFLLSSRLVDVCRFEIVHRPLLPVVVLLLSHSVVSEPLYSIDLPFLSDYIIDSEVAALEHLVYYCSENYVAISLFFHIVGIEESNLSTRVCGVSLYLVCILTLYSRFRNRVKLAYALLKPPPLATYMYRLARPSHSILPVTSQCAYVEHHRYSSVFERLLSGFLPVLKFPTLQHVVRRDRGYPWNSELELVDVDF